MNLRTVERLHVYYEPEQGRRRRVGRLARKDREILFDYDSEFLRSSLEKSRAAIERNIKSSRKFMSRSRAGQLSGGRHSPTK